MFPTSSYDFGSASGFTALEILRCLHLRGKNI